MADAKKKNPKALIAVGLSDVVIGLSLMVIGTTTGSSVSQLLMIFGVVLMVVGAGLAAWGYSKTRGADGSPGDKEQN